MPINKEFTLEFPYDPKVSAVTLLQQMHNKIKKQSVASASLIYNVTVAFSSPSRQLIFDFTRSTMSEICNFTPHSPQEYCRKKLMAQVKELDWLLLKPGQEYLSNSKKNTIFCMEDTWIKFCSNTSCFEYNWNTKLVSFSAYFTCPPQLKHLMRSMFMDNDIFHQVVSWTEYTLQFADGTRFSRMNLPNRKFYCKFSSDKKPEGSFLRLPSTTIFGLSVSADKQAKELLEQLQEKGSVSPDELDNVDNVSQNNLALLHFEILSQEASLIPKEFSFSRYYQMDRTEKEKQKAAKRFQSQSKKAAQLWDSHSQLTKQKEEKWMESAKRDVERSNKETANIDWSQYAGF